MTERTTKMGRKMTGRTTPNVRRVPKERTKTGKGRIKTTKGRTTTLTMGRASTGRTMSTRKDGQEGMKGRRMTMTTMRRAEDYDDDEEGGGLHRRGGGR